MYRTRAVALKAVEADGVKEQISVQVTSVEVDSKPAKRLAAKLSDAAGPKKAKRAKKPKAALEARAVTDALQEKAERIQSKLEELYPTPPIPLDHGSDFQLLVSVILSAQTTDKKVNKVTPALFALAPDAATMATTPAPQVEELIREVGLAPTKARNVVKTAQLLTENHGGAVPATFEELEALPGVGHKTASVVMAQCHGIPAFPVDTHIHRLAQRWGLSSGRSVEQTEADLKSLFDESTWNSIHLQIIYFGREHCGAKAHDPSSCPICSWACR